MTSLHFTFIINPFQPRAQNEARLRRHKEVEEDKKSAGSGQGKGQQGRDTSTTAGDDETPFRNPFGSTTKKPDGPTKRPDGAGPSALRSSAAPRPAVAAGGVGHASKRLGDNDGPPPDPGYRYANQYNEVIFINFLAQKKNELDSIETLIYLFCHFQIPSRPSA